VGIYLYDPTSSNYWFVDQQIISSLPGNSVAQLNNWDIDMNNYPSLPPPGNYRFGAWADTANTIVESNKGNNASLFPSYVQVCAKSTGLKNLVKSVNYFEISPNPVSTSGNIALNLINDEIVKINLLDLTGKTVSELFEGKLNPGNRKITFDTEDLAPGIYFASVKTSEGVSTRKIVVQK
jgi:hypothetical protein